MSFVLITLLLCVGNELGTYFNGSRKIAAVRNDNQKISEFDNMCGVTASWDGCNSFSCG